MARKIVVLCDRHLADDVEVPGRDLPAWDGRVIALCQECEVELYKPLAELVDMFGVREDGSPVRRPYKRKAPAAAETGSPSTAAAAGPIECGECGQACSTIGALWQHAAVRHGLGRPAYRERYGDPLG